MSAQAVGDWPPGVYEGVSEAMELQKNGKLDEALASLDALYNKTDAPLGKSRILVSKAGMLKKAGRTAEAQTALEQAVAMNATNDFERVTMASALDDIYMETKNHDAGLKLLEGMKALLQRDPDRLGAIYFRLAEHNRAQGKRKEALTNIDSALSSSPAPPLEWRDVKVDLTCAENPSGACADAILDMARSRRLPAANAEKLDSLLKPLLQVQPPLAQLEAAKAEGLIGNDGTVKSRLPVGYLEAIPLMRIEPVYPRLAFQDKITGWVDLDFSVTPEGHVGDAKLLAANPRGVFEAAALGAFVKWLFRPHVVDGKAVAFRSIQRIEFKIEANK